MRNKFNITLAVKVILIIISLAAFLFAMNAPRVYEFILYPINGICFLNFFNQKYKKVRSIAGKCALTVLTFILFSMETFALNYGMKVYGNGGRHTYFPDWNPSITEYWRFVYTDMHGLINVRMICLMLGIFIVALALVVLCNVFLQKTGTKITKSKIEDVLFGEMPRSDLEVLANLYSDKRIDISAIEKYCDGVQQSDKDDVQEILIQAVQAGDHRLAKVLFDTLNKFTISDEERRYFNELYKTYREEVNTGS